MIEHNWENEKRLYRTVAGHPNFVLYQTLVNDKCEQGRIEHNWETENKIIQNCGSSSQFSFIQNFSK